MTYFSAPVYLRKYSIPISIYLPSSIIVLVSLVKYGSHSAPLIRKVLIFAFLTAASFDQVGNAAPPKPTKPLSLTACKNSSTLFTTGALILGSFSFLPSEAITIASTVLPIVFTGSIAVTVPDTLACTGDETSPSSLAINCPT